MATLEKWQMGDPEKVMMRRQAMNKARNAHNTRNGCDNCSHKVTAKWRDKVLIVCDLRGQKFGVPCSAYEEK